MIITAIIECLLEIASYYNDGNMSAGHRELGMVLKSLQYIGNTVFAFVWTVYADYKLFSDPKRLKTRAPYLAIPSVFVVIGSIVNLFVPVFYWIDPVTNVYQRSSMNIITYLIVFFYLLYGTCLIYRHRNRVGKYMVLPAIIFMIPIIISSVLDFMFYGIPLKQIGIAIALTSVYINVQKEISDIDWLSGLRTRQFMMDYLRRIEKMPLRNQGVAGILLDVDEFKSINDNYGHLEGDIAIQTFGSILHESISKSDFAVRFAGDEFVIILKNNGEKDVQTTIATIYTNITNYNNTAGKPYQLDFSWGYSILKNKEDTIDSFLECMDQEMYKQKQKKKLMKIESHKRV